MRICLFGSKLRVITFANQLVQKDIEVHLIPNRKVSDGIFSKIDSRVVCHEQLINCLKFDNKINLFLYPFTLYRLKKIINEINPDIVHCFSTVIYGWFITLINFHPFVVTTMGGDINSEQGAMKNFIRRILTPYAIRTADAVTVQSEQGYRAVNNIDNTKEKIIFRAGFSKQLFHYDIKPEYLLERYSISNEFILLSIRGMNKPIYNIETIVNGFRIFKKINEKTKLIILGNRHREYGEKIVSMVNRHNLEGDVIFPGVIKQSEISDYINLSDVVLSFPYNDGSPASIMESFACAKPVIAGYNKSIEEIIVNGINGFIVDTYDYKELSKKLLRLHSDKNLYERISKNNLQEAKVHRVGNYTTKMLDVYCKLLKNNSNKEIFSK